jgi:hypothetical protein
MATGINMYIKDYKDFPTAFMTETLLTEGNLSWYLSSYLNVQSPTTEQKIYPWACPFDKRLYLLVGGSYLYLPFTYRQNYTIPPMMIFNNIPLISLMQDAEHHSNKKINIVRIDCSVIEEKDSEYQPGAAWLSKYQK